MQRKKHILIQDTKSLPQLLSLTDKNSIEELSNIVDNLDKPLSEDYINEFDEKRKRKFSDDADNGIRHYQYVNNDQDKTWVETISSKKQKLFHVANNTGNLEIKTGSLHNDLSKELSLSLAVIGGNLYRLYLGGYYPEYVLMNEKYYDNKTHQVETVFWRASRHREAEDRIAEDKIHHLMLALIVAYFLYDGDFANNLLFTEYKDGYKAIKIDPECTFADDFNAEEESKIKEILTFYYNFPINLQAYEKWASDGDDYFRIDECLSNRIMGNSKKGESEPMFNKEVEKLFKNASYYTYYISNLTLHRENFEDIFLQNEKRRHELFVALALVLSKTEKEYAEIIDKVLGKKDNHLKQTLLEALRLRTTKFKNAAFEVLPGFQSYFNNQDYKKDPLYQEIMQKPTKSEKLSFSIFKKEEKGDFNPFKNKEANSKKEEKGEETNYNPFGNK